MPPKQPPPFVLNKKIVLHFDLNFVIQLLHPSVEDYINEMVAECSWGKVDQKDQKSPLVWKLVHLTLSRTAPEGQVLTTYKSFVESTHIQQKQPSKKELYSSFIKGPGLKLKSEVQKLFKSITIPKQLSEFIKSQLDSKEQHSNNYTSLLNVLSTGRYQLLPAFYKLILSLRKAKREFALVFHAETTTRHEDIINELNLFYNGEHPFYNGKNSTPLIKFDGSKGTRNFRITDKNTCEYYRFDKEFVEDYATFGTKKVFPEKDIEGLRNKLLQIKTETKLLQSSEIYSYSHVLLKESASIYCIDSHKMMMIDPVDYNTHEIYFHVGKVSVLSILGQRLNNTKDKLTHQVDTFELLRDVDYFIKAVEVCQKNRAVQIQKIQKGVEEQQKKKQEPVRESDAEYLKRTILPLLEGALRIVDIERPDDPLGVIAMYCLKNKHRIRK